MTFVQFVLLKDVWLLSAVLVPPREEVLVRVLCVDLFVDLDRLRLRLSVHVVQLALVAVSRGQGNHCRRRKSCREPNINFLQNNVHF
jgi:hypothetical protein